LTAFLAGGRLAAIAVLLYLLTYFITSLGAFGVITVLSNKEKDFESLDDFRGLAFNHPYLSGIFTAMLFSLAGIPLTAGFIGKFYIFSANVDARMWLLLSSLIITSVIGLFYYLRIIVTLYLPANESLEPQPYFGFTPSWSLGGGLTLAFLAISLVWIGIYPSPFITIVNNIVNSLI
jgi:NADH-quinone oxidoreductase subunit N